jgi:hypothetical protein
MSYNIYMRYNPERPKEVSKPNKEMIEFTDKHIDQINRTGIEVVLTLIDQDDTETLKILEKKGVKKLPALLGKGIRDPIQKVDKIKKFLLNNAKSKKAIPMKDGSEELREYQWDALAAGDDDAENDNKRSAADIQARMEFEKRRRDKHGQSSDKMMTADEIIAQQRRGKQSQIRNKPRAPDPPSSDDDSDEEEKPRRKKTGRRRTTNDPDPADIMANMRATTQDEAIDNDLSTKFWSGRGVGTDS